MTASFSLRNTAVLAFSALSRPIVAVIGGARRIAAVLRNRRDAAMLASFNERMLADIGLTRSDLNDAFAEPPWRDPTAVLVKRVDERKASRRRSLWPWPARAVRAPSIVPPNDGCEADHQISRM